MSYAISSTFKQMSALHFFLISILLVLTHYSYCIGKKYAIYTDCIIYINYLLRPGRINSFPWLWIASLVNALREESKLGTTFQGVNLHILFLHEESISNRTVHISSSLKHVYRFGQLCILNSGQASITACFICNFQSTNTPILSEYKCIT